ncbi:Uncharacterised protein [Xylophilus ampelinus]|nr:Uncharacterised protein [Xylophilus ampelinus]
MRAVPTLTPEPLSATDRALLRDWARGGRRLTRVLAVVAAVAGLAGLWLFVHAFSLPPVEVLAARVVAGAALATAAMLAWLRGRARRQSTAPAMAALAGGRKTVAQGRLDGVQIAGTRLRYRLDGTDFDLFNLLPDQGRSQLSAGRPLRELLVPTAQTVALHWVEDGQGSRWLLQLHVPAWVPAQAASRPAAATDRRAAGTQAFIATGFLTAAILACFALLSWIGGFERRDMHFIGLLLAGLWALLVAAVVLPTLLRAQRQTHVQVLRGPVTEVLRGRISSGKTSVDAHWYRMGGLAQAATGFAATLQPGDEVQMEWLTHAQAPPGEGTLIRVQRIGMAP